MFRNCCVLKSVASALSVTFLAANFAQSVVQAGLVTFDDLPPGQEGGVPGVFNGNDPAGRYYGGPNPIGVVESGPYGPVNVRTFTSGGVTFTNRHDQTFGSWSGFAYSNVMDTTTASYLNQYAAYPGTGTGAGRDNYGVAFGYDDVHSNLYDPNPFDPMNAADLLALPTFTLPSGFSIVGMDVANTTYAALSMLHGDGFAKPFGGTTGTDPDWFKLTAHGIGFDGNPLPEFVEFYLADYRFADSSLDFIVDTWEYMDLSALSNAQSLHFNLSSSDSGEFGMNTPSYFAVDDIRVESAIVPEPSALLLALWGGTGVVAARFGRRRFQMSAPVSRDPSC